MKEPWPGWVDHHFHPEFRGVSIDTLLHRIVRLERDMPPKQIQFIADSRIRRKNPAYVQCLEYIEHLTNEIIGRTSEADAITLLDKTRKVMDLLTS